jgi:uncharacterized protein (DUF1501 family)
LFVFLRGGADGLSLLVPYREEAYYCARPRTAIAPPGRAKSKNATALDLDGRFGLHPALSPLLPLWESGELRFVVGAGLAPETSHFVAARAVDAALASALGSRTLVTSHRTKPEERLIELAQKSAGLPTPAGAIVDIPGWDLHTLQGDARGGRLVDQMSTLASTLLALRKGSGGEFTNTRVVVVTEFGRSLFETPLSGTDDGDASVMMVLGPRDSDSGRVWGRFPGLAPGQLSRQRNVAITTDLRQVVMRVAAGEPVIA